MVPLAASCRNFAVMVVRHLIEVGEEAVEAVKVGEAEGEVVLLMIAEIVHRATMPK